MKQVPNVSRAVEVPETFEAHATRLGYTTAELVWLLAADVCTREPERINCVMRPALPANIVAFPQTPEREEAI